jgi:hypothetical protein
MTDEVTFRSQHKILRWSFLCLNVLILVNILLYYNVIIDLLNINSYIIPT